MAHQHNKTIYRAIIKAGKKTKSETKVMHRARPSDVRRPLMQTSHSKLISSMSSISSHKIKARQAMSLISHDLQHRCISCLFL